MLRRLFPVLSDSLYSGADWSEHDGLLTIRRVDLDGDEATRWLRIVHVPETGPTWFSDLIDLRRVNYPFRLNLALKPGVRVEGSLGERVPRPVKNGRIVAEIIDGTDSWSHWTWLASAKIDPDGKFVLESLPAEENLQLIASATAGSPAPPQRPRSPPTQPSTARKSSTSTIADAKPSSSGRGSFA